MLFRIIDDQLVQWQGEVIDNVRHPLSIIKWSDEELAVIGLYKVQDADPIPEGKVLVGRNIQLIDGRPKYVNLLGDPVVQGPGNFDLTARQLRLGLVRNGISLAAVQAMIDGIEDPMIRDEAQIYWEYSSHVNWDHPMTQTLMGMLGIPQENMAYMWMMAKDYEL